jgi:hypothetical protein
VDPGAAAEALKAEIQGKLKGLVDPGTGQIGIREAFDTAKLYRGPYLENAPDLLVGYNTGYRISWDSASGVVAGPVFEDNVKAWSGDHCIDPRLVPGVFFANRPINCDDPALVDIAPTVLRLFGIDAPAHMEGRSLMPADSPRTAAREPRSEVLPAQKSPATKTPGPKSAGPEPPEPSGPKSSGGKPPKRRRRKRGVA